MPRALPENAVRGSFREDRFKGVSGPFSVPPWFIEEMERIDPRLVIRWMPHHFCYMVWLRMSHTGLLWGQPTLILRWADGSPRKPVRDDLYHLRRSSWMGRHTGARAFIDQMERQLIDDQRAAEEHRDKAIREFTQQKCKELDIAAKHFGISRGAFTSTGKADGLAT